MVNNAAITNKPPVWVEQQIRTSAEDYGIPEGALIDAEVRNGRMEAHVQFMREIPLFITSYQYKFDYTTRSATVVAGG